MKYIELPSFTFFIPPMLCFCPLNKSLVRLFSMRRSAWGHFWLIRPSTSFSHPLPFSLEMNESDPRKYCAPTIQKGWEGLGGEGNFESFPSTQGRNSFWTCEWPKRKATYQWTHDSKLNDNDSNKLTYIRDGLPKKGSSSF